MAWNTIGYEPQKEYISRSWRQGRLAHAYLLTGSSQIGRRRLALDIAKLGNCTAAEDASPCGFCNSCRRIENGSHPDIVHISSSSAVKGASATRTAILLEQIHQLRRLSALKPYDGKYRVFILDGAEDMSSEASNALLKTLEEPNGNTLIILIAGSVAGVLPTISSRCQVIQMAPLPARLLEAKLGELSSDEKLIQTVAALAEGRMGWAINAIADPTEMEQLAQAQLRCRAMATGDIVERFSVASELAARWNTNRKGVLEELDRWNVWWRNVAINKVASAEQNGGGENAVTEMAKGLTAREIATAWEGIANVIAALRNNASPRLALEVLALQMPQRAVEDAAA